MIAINNPKVFPPYQDKADSEVHIEIYSKGLYSL